MAEINLDEIRNLWFSTPGNTWLALRLTLERQWNNTSLIDPEDRDSLYQGIRYLENTSENFPLTPEELYSMLTRVI